MLNTRLTPINVNVIVLDTLINWKQLLFCSWRNSFQLIHKQVRHKMIKILQPLSYLLSTRLILKKQRRLLVQTCFLSRNKLFVIYNEHPVYFSKDHNLHFQLKECISLITVKVINTFDLIWNCILGNSISIYDC